MKDESLLVGLETSDDAAVYKIDEKTALIHTIDFFTPIIDDPYLYGQIAACNSLSDVYAMGGEPLLALNIVGFPEELVEDILPLVLKGGADKVKESGAVIAGGHTIKNPEPFYGLSVIGRVNLGNITTNSASKPGDVLILTKPLGTGIIATAYKAQMLKDEILEKAVEVMCTLNKTASFCAVSTGIKAITDITGFGLLGHACEMAEASDVSFEINVKDVPIIDGTFELASMGLLPAGLYANKKYLKEKIQLKSDINEEILDILFDPQTSGGLLISCPEDKLNILLSNFKDKNFNNYFIIGRVVEKREKRIYLE